MNALFVTVADKQTHYINMTRVAVLKL